MTGPQLTRPDNSSEALPASYPAHRCHPIVYHDPVPHRADDNIINISAVLFMWSATTGFTAASYVPALVMERGLFVRERNDGACGVSQSVPQVFHLVQVVRVCCSYGCYQRA